MGENSPAAQYVAWVCLTRNEAEPVHGESLKKENKG
jgi:hypothetical protein